MKLSFYDLLNLEQCCFLYDPGGGAFAFSFGPSPGHLTDLFIPTPGNLPFFFNANARGLARGGGWALLELTDALRLKDTDRAYFRFQNTMVF